MINGKREEKRIRKFQNKTNATVFTPFELLWRKKHNKPLNLNNKHAVCFEKVSTIYLFIPAEETILSDFDHVTHFTMNWNAINKMEKREAELNWSIENSRNIDLDYHLVLMNFR